MNKRVNETEFGPCKRAKIEVVAEQTRYKCVCIFMYFAVIVSVAYGGYVFVKHTI